MHPSLAQPAHDTPPKISAAAITHPTRPKRGGGQAAARRIDTAQLARDYAAGQSTTDLAGRHGVSTKTIAARLKAAGVRLRGVAEARKLRAKGVYRKTLRPEPIARPREIADIFVVVHRTTRTTPTPFGFDLLRGPPLGARHCPIILTRELVAHLLLYRLDPGRCGLPLSVKTLSRLRRRLDLDWRADNRAWWEEHCDELATTTRAAPGSTTRPGSSSSVGT